MSEKKQEKPVQLSFDDLKNAKPDWQVHVQPLDGGHVKVIVSKRPSKGK